MLRLAWRVYWKVTLSASLGMALLFLTLHHDDFREFSAQTLFGAVAVLGYCLFYASIVGIAAVLFAVAWRFWGAWILLPLGGAVAGAIAFVGIGLALIAWLDPAPARAGLHGGGHLLAMIFLAGAAVVAIVGAAIGGFVGALLGALLGLRRRRTPPTAAERK